jgi:hypothetical protein
VHHRPIIKSDSAANIFGKDFKRGNSGHLVERVKIVLGISRTPKHQTNWSKLSEAMGKMLILKLGYGFMFQNKSGLTG